jgi:hypothetical protein
VLRAGTQNNGVRSVLEDAGEAMARPCFGVRSEKNLRQKRYTKVFGKKASERERLLNGNYALCIFLHYYA